MKYGHLERYEISLQTVSPVFIGSGRELTKKEYIFDRAKGVIYILNFARFIDFLSAHSLLPAYETFILQPGRNDLFKFLSENNIRREEFNSFVSYTIDAGEAAHSKLFRGVQTFVKGPDGRPYIPGSSLKGALRTAIAAKLSEKYNFKNIVSKIENEANNPKGKMSDISKEADHIESQLFCRLGITDPNDPDKFGHDDIVNDFMKGISISDSTPIGFENLTLCGKYDRKPDGTVKQIPTYRECLAPGASIDFVLTLDMPVVEKVGINLKYIKEALNYFSEKYYENFERYFSVSTEDLRVKTKGDAYIMLGGGAGYATKTITYPLVHDRERAVRLVGTIMNKQFRKHKHENDARMYKVSPHILKTTYYKGLYYQMGRCMLTFK